MYINDLDHISTLFWEQSTLLFVYVLRGAIYSRKQLALCICSEELYIQESKQPSLCMCSEELYIFRKATFFVYVLRGAIHLRKQPSSSICSEELYIQESKQLSLWMCSEELYIQESKQLTLFVYKLRGAIFKKASNPLYVCAPRSYLSRTDADGRSKMLMSRL